MLYFAYGTNLNLRDMRRRCPAAKPVGAATLKDHKLVFRHFADLAPESGSTVSGALYEITPGCQRALDAYEGKDYRQVTLSVETAEGPREAMAYVMGKGDLAPPDLEYFTTIARGYGDWKFDADALRKARFATLHPANPAFTKR